MSGEKNGRAMKLHILYDRTGKILAAVHLDPVEQPYGREVGELRPVPGKGQMAGDFDVPREFAERGFVEACRALRVDPKMRKLVAIKDRGQISAKSPKRAIKR